MKLDTSGGMKYDEITPVINFIIFIEATIAR